MGMGIDKVLLRIANFWFTNLQMKLKREKVVGYPTYLYADITNVCNLKCPLCATGSGASGGQKGMMSLEMFKKIVDEIGKYLVKIHLYNWGEPLLNKDVYEMIDYAHRHHIVTCMSTNFTLFSEDSAERLIRSGLDEITLSIDGASRETLWEIPCRR